MVARRQALCQRRVQAEPGRHIRCGKRRELTERADAKASKRIRRGRALQSGDGGNPAVCLGGIPAPPVGPRKPARGEGRRRPPRHRQSLFNGVVAILVLVEYYLRMSIDRMSRA